MKTRDNNLAKPSTRVTVGHSHSSLSSISSSLRDAVPFSLQPTSAQSSQSDYGDKNIQDQTDVVKSVVTNHDTDAPANVDAVTAPLCEETDTVWKSPQNTQTSPLGAQSSLSQHIPVPQQQVNKSHWMSSYPFIPLVTLYDLRVGSDGDVNIIKGDHKSASHVNGIIEPSTMLVCDIVSSLSLRLLIMKLSCDMLSDRTTTIGPAGHRSTSHPPTHLSIMSIFAYPFIPVNLHDLHMRSKGDVDDLNMGGNRDADDTPMGTRGPDDSQYIMASGNKDTTIDPGDACDVSTYFPYDQSECLND